MNSSRGFSLIELMITVSIIGILAAIAVPSYQTYVNKARTVDLLTTSRMGEMMVTEYIQSTGATDCTAMPGQNATDMPISAGSPNTGDAYIDTKNTDGFGPCSVVVISTPALSNPGQYFTYRVLQLYSIPTFNTDGSLTWVTYSNGSPAAPANIQPYTGSGGQTMIE